MHTVGRHSEGDFLSFSRGPRAYTQQCGKHSVPSPHGRRSDPCPESPAASQNNTCRVQRALLKAKLFCIHHRTIPCHLNVCIFIFFSGAIGTWKTKLTYLGRRIHCWVLKYILLIHRLTCIVSKTIHPHHCHSDSEGDLPPRQHLWGPYVLRCLILLFWVFCLNTKELGESVQVPTAVSAIS